MDTLTKSMNVMKKTIEFPTIIFDSKLSMNPSKIASWIPTISTTDSLNVSS